MYRMCLISSLVCHLFRARSFFQFPTNAFFGFNYFLILTDSIVSAVKKIEMNIVCGITDEFLVHLQKCASCLRENKNKHFDFSLTFFVFSLVQFNRIILYYEGCSIKTQKPQFVTKSLWHTLLGGTWNVTLNTAHSLRWYMERYIKYYLQSEFFGKQFCGSYTTSQ